MIGTKLAHYEITAHLGSGGMGDVYQATDTKLGRAVAIKFLSEAFSHDTDRVARFQREARVLASLNHPNIAAIYGVEEIDSRHFLVMELVLGETLADRIKRGGIPIEEALLIAKQIAEALEEAHEKGIIHRDLKPANIKVTPDGKLKALDFGLAKAYEREQANAELSNSPTISIATTNIGVILGTAAYMSPEQAKGNTVDKRADIWAFGVVLYEMLAGKMAFSGETASETMAGVMMMEPDWNALPANTPWRLQRLLRRCLKKDARNRLQAIGEARIAIEEVQSGSATTALIPQRGHRGRDHVWMSAFVVVSLIAAVLAVTSVRHFRETPPVVPPEMRLDIVTPTTDDPMSFALSPDGSQIVYAASGSGVSRLWLRPLASSVAQSLAGTEGATYPFWSPDSRSVGFFANNQLKRLDLGGGGPQVLANAVAGRGGTWNAAGVILFTPSPGVGPILRLKATGGGEAVPVTQLGNQRSHRFPHFLPGGRRFLFFAQGTPDTQGIYLGSLDSPQTQRLTPSDTAGAYLSSGWLLWIQAGTLRAQRLDVEGQKLTGDPVTLADPVAFDPGTFAGGSSVSTNGMVAYRGGVAAQRRQLVWFDRAGKALGVLGTIDEDGLQVPRISPDGRRVTVYRTVQGNADVWLLDGAHTTRFTFDEAGNRCALWSPDGNKIVFDSNRRGTRNLYVKSAAGGTEELLVESAQDQVANDWSRDGRFLLFGSIDPQSNWDLWVVPLEGDRKPWVFLKTKYDERWAQFSPDGRWVTYESNESGRDEIYVRPFVESGAGTGEWRQVSTAGGAFPVWRPDGKEIDYLAPDGTLMAAPFQAQGDRFESGAPVALFQARIVGGGVDNAQGRQYDVARDGRFLIDTVVDDAAGSPITLLQNWQPSAR